MIRKPGFSDGGMSKDTIKYRHTGCAFRKVRTKYSRPMIKLGGTTNQLVRCRDVEMGKKRPEEKRRAVKELESKSGRAKRKHSGGDKG